MNLKQLVAKILQDEDTTKYQIAKDLEVSTSTVLGWADGSRSRCFRSMKKKLEDRYSITLDADVIAKHRRGR